MATSKPILYDVLCAVTQKVDDLETLGSLVYASKDCYRLAQPKIWRHLHLTTNRSVTSAFTAILNKRQLGAFVESLRLPDVDGCNNPAIGYNSDPSVGLTDPYALEVLQQCRLAGPPGLNAPLPDIWSYTDARVAAIMALCPNLETVVMDAFPRRDFDTLSQIFMLQEDMDGPFTTPNFPRILHWKVLPDAFDDDQFPSNVMEVFGSKRLDLIAYTDGRFNEAEIDAGLPILRADKIEDLRVEDGVFEFDSQGEEQNDIGGNDAENQAVQTAVPDLYQQFYTFTITNCFQFGHMGSRMAKLVWKITVPFIEPRLPLQIEDGQEYDMETVNRFAEENEEEMSEIDSKANLPLATNNNAEKGGRVSIITPSAFFARSWWIDMEHFDTTVGSVYGHPYVLINNGYVTKAVPSYVEVLILEERWHSTCRPVAAFLSLYRYSLCRDLKLIARGTALPRLRRVVFIPNQSAGYWAGLPEKVEWTRDPNDDDESSEPFPEIDAILEANGDEEASHEQRRQFDAMYKAFNFGF